MMYFQQALAVFAASFVLRLLVYFLAAGLAFYGFKTFKASWLQRKKLHHTPTDTKQIKQELIGSIRTLLIWALMTIPAFFLIANDITANKFGEIGPWYMGIVWFVVLVIVHDTYFYWTHRLIHHARIFKWCHSYHHQSVRPTPFAIFSFDATEAVINYSIGYLFLLFAPCHVLITVLWFLFMVAYNVLGHLGYELYPHWLVRNKWTGILNSSTHHAMHHRYFNCNYGLYFTFWDRVMGTEHPQYIATHLDVVNGKKI